MRSPSSSVGSIDDDGMRNGSATKERSRKMMRMTGNSERAYSTTTGMSVRPSARRFGASTAASNAQIRPPATVSTKSSKAKSTLIPFPSVSLFLSDVQHGQEGFLRNLHPADLLHALLARLLLLQQLALATDVAAVALGGDVLAQRLDAAAGDDLVADRGLHGDLEHLPRYQFLHLLGEIAAARICMVLVNDVAERVNLLAVDQQVQLHQRRRLEVRELVVEGREAAAHRLQAVEDIQYHRGQRQLVGHLHLRAGVVHLRLHAALLYAQVDDIADMF